MSAGFLPFIEKRGADTRIMEDNKQDKTLTTEEIENREELRKTARHTWIGDRDEVRPDMMQRTVTRMTFPQDDVRDTRMVSTKLVEKERKPYKGFITDEEVEFAEKAAEVDRMARAERMAARQTMTQTRVYSGFGSGMEEEKAPETETNSEQEHARVRRRRSFNIQIADSRKFRRLIVLAAAFLILLAFEISFAVMKAETASLPGKTADLKTQTETLQTENETLQKSADELGEYDQIKELRDSWQRIKDKLAE